MAHRKGIADRITADLAGRAHGVVTRRELVEAGLSAEQIRHRLDRGSLIPAHRGVYRVGHTAPSVDAAYLAAVLACGAGSALGGLAAVHHYGILRGPAPPAEVTSPRERRVPGVAVLRVRRLSRADTTTWRGVPIVTLPRALVEIAGRLGAPDLARACHEAGVLYRTTPAQVERALARWFNAPGAAKLRKVVAGDVAVSLSRLEAGFLAVLRDRDLPRPDTNRPAGGRRVDCRWPEAGLTVELDSYAFHNSRHAWERDRRREREAYARGDQFRRYTWADVFEQPAGMHAELEGLLRAEPS